MRAERAQAHDIPLDSIASYINCFKCARAPILALPPPRQLPLHFLPLNHDLLL
jgi:hypothetical protein